MKFIEEVEKNQELFNLVTSWKRDPCWDLEKTEGFEKYENQLRLYSIYHQIKWNNEHMERLIKHADQFDPVKRAFELENLRQETNKLTDELFEETGRITMNF
jgi:hypothetical protein